MVTICCLRGKDEQVSLRLLIGAPVSNDKSMIYPRDIYQQNRAVAAKIAQIIINNLRRNRKMTSGVFRNLIETGGGYISGIPVYIFESVQTLAPRRNYWVGHICDPRRRSTSYPCRDGPATLRALGFTLSRAPPFLPSPPLLFPPLPFLCAILTSPSLPLEVGHLKYS